MRNSPEQMAGSLDISVLAKATELKKRLWFVLGALVVFRIGTYIPLPGIDPEIIREIFERNAGGILGMFNVFTGGALSRNSIFVLGVMPYITASIIVMLLTSAFESLKALQKEGEAGRRKLNQYKRWATILIATAQGYGLATGLENMTSDAGSAVINPGMFFRLTTALTIVASTMYLMWLGEQITSRGIGNGVSLIIFAGIIAEIPGALAGTFELGRTGAITTELLLGLIVLLLLLITCIVFFERAQRRILVQYPKRQVSSQRMVGGESTHLPLKVNTAGVMPPILASAILLFPLTIANFNAEGMPEWLGGISAYLTRGNPVFIACYAAAIVFFAFFFTAVVFNTEDTAENLKKYGGFIPGIRPGAHTAEYLDRIMSRLTTVGAAYLAFICIVPEVLISRFGVPAYLGSYIGGTSLLIVVNVTMDTVTQVQSHLFAHQYEGLIKNARLRTKGKKKR